MNNNAIRPDEIFAIQLECFYTASSDPAFKVWMPWTEEWLWFRLIPGWEVLDPRCEAAERDIDDQVSITFDSE
jgi:hypothetical protein